MKDPKYQEGEPPGPASSTDDTVIVSPDTRRAERIPPGQTRTRKWPVLDAHGTPAVPDASQWRLRVFGAVEQARSWSLPEFRALPRVKVFSDFHCVTTWSRLGNLWEGVSAGTLLDACVAQPEAKFVVLHAYDQQWTTNLPLADFLSEDVLLADTHDGEPLSADHGGPVRAIVPQLYAWKSAKWICGIELASADRRGYWEQLGYHDHGDPWIEERFNELRSS